MPGLPSLRSRLEDLVRIPSVSSTQPDLDQDNLPVVELLAEWVSDLGFQTQVIDVAPGKANLIATLGQGADGLVLSGHTDTVPCDEELWTQNPFELTERDDKWYGLGAIDMKGFFPLALEALSQFDLHKIKRPLVLVATCDEESSMAGAQRLVQLGRKLGRATLIGEPTNLVPIRAHKGIMMERLKLIGRSGHSSDPSLGQNALDAMSDCLVALKQLRALWVEKYQHKAFLIPHPTLNMGCIHGGDNPNRICGHCALDFDIRTVPGMNADDIRAAIRQAIDPICRRHEVAYQLTPLIDALNSFEQASQTKLVTSVEALTGTPSASVAFATEAPYFQSLSDEVIVMGAGSIDVAHQPNEYLDLSTINPAIKCFRALIHNYCFQEEKS